MGMLIVSMGVSVDGFIKDRDGGFDWAAPDEEQFRFHIEQVSELGVCLLGRNLYETMLVWETDPAMRHDEDQAEFADVWSAIPKVVFSHTLDQVEGNARLATGTSPRRSPPPSPRPRRTSRSAAPASPPRQSNWA